jgi:SAM-dependent methyltransferase
MVTPQFDAVDATDPAAAAAFLDLALSLPSVEHWKRFSHDLLAIADGDRVLDIGCGTGSDAMALARRVGSDGQVVGVDLSHALVAVAQARAAPLGLPVTFRQADIHDLPFVDGAFDCTRIDRLLHFLPDPGKALREAARVTAPGGRMVVTEPDWTSLTVAGADPDLAAVMLAAGAEQAAPGARIGSALPRLLAQAGLQPTGHHASMLDLRDYATAATLFGLEALASRAVGTGRVEAKTAVRWLRSLQQASARGTFRCTLAGVIAAASSPANCP